MKTLDDSRRLAESLVAIGNASGVRTEALITDDGCSAWPCRRQRERNRRVHRDVERRGPRGSRIAVGGSSRRGCWCSRGLASAEADEARRRCARALAVWRGARGFPSDHREPGWRPAVIDDYTRLPSAPDEARGCAASSGYVAEIASGARRPCGGRPRRGPGAARRHDRSRGRNLGCRAAGAPRSKQETPCFDRPPPRRARSRRSAAAARQRPWSIARSAPRPSVHSWWNRSLTARTHR